jgi:hypothetical protein
VTAGLPEYYRLGLQSPSRQSQAYMDVIANAKWVAGQQRKAAFTDLQTYSAGGRRATFTNILNRNRHAEEIPHFLSLLREGLGRYGWERFIRHFFTTLDISAVSPD